MLNRFSLASLATLTLLAIPASAAEKLVIGLQESGTVQWEIAAMQALGIDKAHDIELEIRPLADSRAGQIALQTGAVDVILSDFVWVSVQRHEGNNVTMVPHSLTVGGLVAPADTAITSIDALAGKTLGVAGGPADKSWVILQAYYREKTGADLNEAATVRFGAPPLVNELLGSGGIDAGLNFWQWNARAKATGMVEVLSVADMLSDLGIAQQPPLLGWTFTDTLANERPEAISKFLDASFATKGMLLTDDSVWDGLAKLMGADEDPALFAQLRKDYRLGIVTTYDAETITAAEDTFAILARGGTDVIGDHHTLASGTFWLGYLK